MSSLEAFMEQETVVEGEWQKTDKGWSHIPQQMKWESILQWQVEMFFYSCYLYYVLDNPKLDDAGFDRIVEILENHFNELPERITHTVGPGQIKANAHLFAHDLTEKEKENALLWKNNEL
jgi:NAD-dependent DNA ligase